MVAQQLQQIAQATADATGAATFQWASVPQGLAWLGNVRVASAPYTATFVATIGLDDWGAWQGPLYGGEIRADSNVTLKVAATNLTPGVTYVATWLGISDNVDAVGPARATASPATPQAFGANTFIAITATATAYDSGLIPCSNVKGARYAFVNHSAGAPVLVQLVWWAAGLSPTIPLGARNVIIPTAVVGLLPAQALFTHPHLGDQIQVKAAPIGGGNLNMNVAVAHHDQDRITWDGIGLGQPGVGASGSPDVLFTSAGNVSVAATSNAVIASSLVTFGGWIGIDFRTAATVFTIELQAQDSAGGWNTLYSWSNGQITLGVNEMVIVPPSPLRALAVNGDGGAQNFSFIATADSWR